MTIGPSDIPNTPDIRVVPGDISAMAWDNNPVSLIVTS